MTPTDRLFSESYLRRLESLALVYRRMAASQMQGERRSRRHGHSVEFADFRPYALGDDFRRVDWNAYARLEKLFIKLFVEEQEITISLLVDNSPSMDWGEPNKFDYAVRAAASLGYVGLVNLDRVKAGAVYSAHNRFQTLKPVRGKRSALALFNFLKSIQIAEPGASFENPNNIHAARDRGVVFIFSDLMDDPWQSQVNQFRSLGQEVVLVHILSPDELEPAFAGDFRLTDQESSAEVEITADFETLRDYRAKLESWQDQWRGFCKSRDVTYLPVATTTEIEELMFSLIPAQGILA